MGFTISKGMRIKPLRCVIYGTEGIGKSTFASHFPNPLFIDTEGSTNFLDVARFDPPTSWAMLLAEIDHVIASPEICDTLVIDTIDWAEKLCVDHVIAANGWKSIESPGYGAGYRYVYEEFGKLLNKCSMLPDKGVNIVMTGHAALRRVEQPDEMGSYDKWELKLQASQKCSIAAMVKEWADMVLFANYKTMVVKDNDKAAKGKGVGGRRVMYANHRPCWDAKNRQGLPDEMEFSYECIKHVVPGRNSSVNSAPDSRPDPRPSGSTVPAAPDPGNVPARPVSDAGDRPALRKLLDLIHSNGFGPDDVVAAVTAQGAFPNVPVEQYPDDFIEMLVTQAWPQVQEWIATNRMPF